MAVTCPTEILRAGDLPTGRGTTRIASDAARTSPVSPAIAGFTLILEASLA